MELTNKFLVNKEIIMLVTKYDPFNEFRSFKRGFDLVNELVNSIDSKSHVANVADFKPLVNTLEGTHAYHIQLDLPGVKKEDIDVHVEDNTLTISGERKFKEERSEEDYYKIESSYGKFSRSFSLPEKVDLENIHANCEDGVLEVVIPKLEIEIQKAKKIEIK
jgi:HSP20 family protein